MKRHLYAFGSLCRGEIDEFSDIDLLACVETQEQARQIDSARFSIYTHDRIRALWSEGNPFAWHLHLESKLMHTSDGRDFLQELHAPYAYTNADVDCAKFIRLFQESLHSLRGTSDSRVFHLSCMFLATRNFATCYSFTRGRPIFSDGHLCRLRPLRQYRTMCSMYSSGRGCCQLGASERRLHLMKSPLHCRPAPRSVSGCFHCYPPRFRHERVQQSN